MVRLRTLLATGLLLLPAIACAQEGREFLLAWPPTYYESAELLVATGDPRPVRVRVEGPGLSHELDVSAGSPARLPLPPGARLDAGGLHPGGAIRVTAERPVDLLLHAPATEGIPDSLVWTSHDALRVPPADALGESYRALSWPNDWGCGAERCESSTFLVAVAMESGTRLHVGGGPCFEETETEMEAGDALLLRCDGPGDDVTGVRVWAGRPFLLLSGNRGVVLPEEGGSADTLLAAPPPEWSWGTLYHVLHLPRDPFFAGEGDFVRIVAGEGGAGVRVASASREEHHGLPEGGTLTLDGAEWLGEPLRIVADRPVQVAQLAKSRDHRGTGDPALLALAPADSGVREARLLLPDGYGDSYHAGVVAPAGARVLLDGAPLHLDPLPGGIHAGAVLSLQAPPPGTVGEHRLESDRPVTGWVSGQGLYKSFLYPVGRRVPPIVRRGADPRELELLAREAESPWEDADALGDEAPPLLFYRVGPADHLWVGRAGAAVLLVF
jgi:hypothetical protein